MSNFQKLKTLTAQILIRKWSKPLDEMQEESNEISYPKIQIRIETANWQSIRIKTDVQN